MVSVLIGGAVIVAGGYGLYRYFTWQPAVKIGIDSTRAAPAQQLDTSVELTSFNTDVPSPSNLIDTTGDGRPDSTDSGNVTGDSYEDTDSPRRPPLSPDSPPTVAPKPKPITPKVPPAVSPKPSPSRARQKAIPLMPAALTSELEAKLKKRNRGEVIQKTDEQDGPVGPANGGLSEGAVSFEQPIRPAGLISPSRNRGPTNRRPPTRH